MKKQKILMLEDNKLDAKLIKEELTEHKFDFTSELVETKKDFITAIKDFKPNVILSDYTLPHFTGFEALEIAKKLIPDIPFIIVTGSLSEEMAADSIKRGAWDYVLKENLKRLTPAIENAFKLKEEKDKNRQTNEELKSSEERLKILFESAPDAYYLNDLKGTFIDGNKIAEEMLGYKKEELIGKNFLKLNLLPAKELPKAMKALAKSILGEISGPDELLLNRKDGSQVSVEIRTYPVKIKNKTVVLGIARDITERKRAEEKEKTHHKNIQLLSNTAMQFVEFPQDKDIYTFIGEKLKEFTGENSIIVVNSIDTERDILTNRTVLGLGKLSEKVAGLIGKHPVGMTFDAKDQTLSALSDGKLHLNEEGLYGVFFKSVPETICNSIEKLLNIKTIYGIGFAKDNELFGNAVIFLREDAGELKNKQIIETFINQASIAIQKKQAEEALIESNENFQQVVSNITTVVWKADIGKDGAFENTYTSPVVDELLELPAGTIKNDWNKYFSYVKPEYQERVNNAFGEAIKSPGKKFDCEYEVLKDNGQTAWFHSIGRCFEKNGKLHFFGSTSDITERKQAENAFKESEYEKLLILDNMTELIVFRNKNMETVWASKAVSKFLEITPEENIGRVCYKARYNRKTPCPDCKVVLVLKTGNPSQYEDTSPDGKYWDVRCNPVRNESSEIIGTIEVSTDITERKLVEEAIKKSEEKYRSLVETIEEGIGNVNENETFTFVNQAAADIFGYPKKEMIGKNLKELISPEMFQKVLEQSSFRKKGKSSFYELSIIRKNGEQRIITVTATPIISENGEHQGSFGIFHDITERKQAEEALQQHTRLLETLQNVTAALSTSLDLDEVLQLILDQISQAISFDSASIFLIEGEKLNVAIAKGITPDLIGTSYPLDNPLFQEIRSTQKALLISDTKSDSRFKGWGETKKICCWMGIPLNTREGLIGFLTLDSYQPDAYTSEQLALAQPFAGQAAQAIHNARLYQRVIENVNELEKFNKMAVGRELKMIELKKEINELLEKSGEEAIYKIAE